jgi:hypothetical protein
MKRPEGGNRRCEEVLIREEGNLHFECFEAQVLETTPEEKVMQKLQENPNEKKRGGRTAIPLFPRTSCRYCVCQWGAKQIP